LSSPHAEKEKEAEPPEPRRKNQLEVVFRETPKNEVILWEKINRILISVLFCKGRQLQDILRWTACMCCRSRTLD